MTDTNVTEQERTYWQCPVLWPGSVAFVIGGGWSLSGSLDELKSLLQDKHVIGCNDAYLLGDWIDVCFFGDQEWYRKENADGIQHRYALANWSGLKVTRCLNWINEPQLLALHTTNVWQDRPKFIGWFGNTGACAVNLAGKFGAKKIVLVGFDMTQNPRNGKKGSNNWHPNKVVTSERTYENFREAFTNDVKPAAEKRGIEIINATPGSRLDCFPIVTLKEAVQECGS